jgi:hypothetical protein
MQPAYRMFVSAKYSLNVFQAGDAPNYMLKQTGRQLNQAQVYQISSMNVIHFAIISALTSFYGLDVGVAGK